MYNYLIKIEYVGTNFVGWQTQRNGVAIQDKIELALKKILKKKVKIVGAGRTDKGVHAYGQFANFKVEKKIFLKEKFLKSINFFLRNDLISIINIKKVSPKFHARFSAKQRIYEYKIINRKSSLSIDFNKAWHIERKLDLNLLKRGSKILEGKHDFSTFQASSCTSKSSIKKIENTYVKKSGDIITLKFQSKSFLQNQVRSMVGSLKYLAEKKWSMKKFKAVFKSKKRSLCAPPAPACGLYLINVKY